MITKRCNRWYIYTGLPKYLAVPTVGELAVTISDMTRVGHVNRLIVQLELSARQRAPREGEWPMTRIELWFLRDAAVGEQITEFLKRYGVTRAYKFDRVARPDASDTPEGA